MHKFALGLVVATGYCNAADAACPTFPYTFSNGTTADATQVNANFANVATCFAPFANPNFTGNVGIDTATPGFPLTVYTPSTALDLESPASAAVGIRFNVSHSFIGTGNFAVNNGSATTDLGISAGVGGNLLFGIGAGSEAMRINSSGNVGIGTTSPISTLQVNGNLTLGTGASSITYTVNTATSNGSDNDGLSLSGAGAASDTSRGAYVSLLGNEVSYYGLYGDAIITAGQATSGSGGAILFATDPTNGSTNNPITRMFVSNGGNVGIGTTTSLDSGLLSVAGRVTIDSASANGMLVDSGGARSIALGTGDFAVTGGARSDGAIAANNASGNLLFASGGTTERLRIAAGGNVGIGTTSPAYTLQVNGSVAGTSAYVNTSDARLKKNIIPLTNALATIQQLQGVHYEWRTPAERSVGKDLKLDVGQPQVGFIAQDVQKVLPEAVSVSTGPEKIMSVAESKVVPVLVEAVKELKAQNEHLAAIVASEQTRIGALERANAARASINAQSKKPMRLGDLNVDNRSP